VRDPLPAWWALLVLAVLLAGSWLVVVGGALVIRWLLGALGA
jgi:hypothetical protein